MLYYFIYIYIKRGVFLSSDIGILVIEFEFLKIFSTEYFELPAVRICASKITAERVTSVS